jgi:hypothetical protein
MFSCSYWVQELVDWVLTWQLLTRSYFMRVIGIQHWIYRQWIELIVWVRQEMLVPFLPLPPHVHISVDYSIDAMFLIFGISTIDPWNFSFFHIFACTETKAIPFVFVSSSFRTTNIRCIFQMYRLLSTDLYVKRQSKRRFFSELVRKVLYRTLSWLVVLLEVIF